MSDPTEAARVGAQAASGQPPTSAGPEGSSFGSAVNKARQKMATTANEGATVAGRGSDDQAQRGGSEVVETTRSRVVESETRAPMASASRTAPAVTRRTRKARLRLSRIDPWSVMKTVFLFSIAGAIIMMVATALVWSMINASGVFDSINKQVDELLATPGSGEATFRLEDYLNTNKVLGLTALVGAFNVVLLTALATLFSFLYNLAATVMGGLEVTLAED